MLNQNAQAIRSPADDLSPRLSNLLATESDIATSQSEIRELIGAWRSRFRTHPRALALAGVGLPGDGGFVASYRVLPGGQYAVCVLRSRPRVCGWPGAPA